MGEQTFIIVVTVIPVVLVLAVGVVWTLQHKRALHALPVEQRRRMAEVEKSRTRDGALFWVPFCALYVVGGAVAQAFGRRLGIIEIVGAAVVAALLAEITKSAWTRWRRSAVNARRDQHS